MKAVFTVMGAYKRARLDKNVEYHTKSEPYSVFRYVGDNRFQRCSVGNCGYVTVEESKVVKYPLWQIGCYQWQKGRAIEDNVRNLQENIDYAKEKFNEVAAVPKECFEKKENEK